jgi:hypothetical protein
MVRRRPLLLGREPQTPVAVVVVVRLKHPGTLTMALLAGRVLSF